MTYLNNFLYYLLNTSYTYPLYACLFVLFFIEIFLVYKLIFYKKVTRDLKIYNFTLNALYILIYIITFIVIISILRYIRWGYTLNLITFSNNFLLFYKKVPLIFLLDFISLIIILFLLLIKIKYCLTEELLKRHLYYYYSSHLETVKNFAEKNPGNLPTRKDYFFYVQFCDNIELNYNYKRVIERFVFNKIIKPLSSLFSENSYFLTQSYLLFYIRKCFEIFLEYLPKIILIVLFLIDCFYYNYTLHYIFYYLPFYFLIYLWESFSTFIKKTDHLLNNIIYERYYLENLVKYINTSDEEDEFIFKYIERHCICFTHDIKGKDFDTVWEKKEIIYAFPQIFVYNRKYIRVDNTNVFRNYSTGEEILEETLIETPLE